MNPEEVKLAEAKRQELLGHITNAELALRKGLHIPGFGETTAAHLERALAHVREAYVAINETKPIRSVPQLVEDLNRVQQAMDDTRRGRSQYV
jgi:hypothetical protein